MAMTLELPADRPPTVGQVYRVPCVRWRLSIPRLDRIWLPIMGPLHEDADLGVADLHWHFDYRFWSDWMIREIPSRPYNQLPWGMGHPISQRLCSEGPVVRPRRCLREMPEFPHFGMSGGPVKPVQLLEPKFRNRRLPQGCRTCPHRGMPLGDLPRRAGSVVVCPGHGLAWDLETGRMVPRADLEAREERAAREREGQQAMRFTTY